MGKSNGGSYVPNADYTRTGATDTGGTYAGATISGGSVSNTTTFLFNPQVVTATGTTGTTAAALSAITPSIVTTTGASGAGIALPTGAAVPGAIYFVKNINTTGVCNVYAVGGTINGTTGTTGFAMDTTGTAKTWFMCLVAGAWQSGAVST